MAQRTVLAGAAGAIAWSYVRFGALPAAGALLYGIKSDTRDLVADIGATNARFALAGVDATVRGAPIGR